MAIKALILTIFVSVFFLLGLFVPKWIKNKQALLLFTTGMIFVILIYLCFIDLLPEIFEVFELDKSKKMLGIAIIFTLLGFILLKILDFFIPSHSHEHKEEKDDIKEHQSHLYHIGLITAISLILHNLLEGISIYLTGLNDFKLGLIMAFTVGCHNLPLGMEIRLGLDSRNNHKISNMILLLLLISSSFLGAFFLFILNREIGMMLEGIFLSITLGMLLYLLILEIIPEIFKYKKEKMVQLGCILGLIVTIILLFI